MTNTTDFATKFAKQIQSQFKHEELKPLIKAIIHELKDYLVQQRDEKQATAKVIANEIIDLKTSIRELTMLEQGVESESQFVPPSPLEIPNCIIKEEPVKSKSKTKTKVEHE